MDDELRKWIWGLRALLARGYVSFRTIYVLTLLLTINPANFAHAVSLTDILSGGSLMSDADANAIMTAAGLGLRHRAYEPASPMGVSGFSGGIESSLVQPPSTLATAFSNLSSLSSVSVTGSSTSTSSSSAMTIPILPSLKFHVRKGLASNLDMGLSFLPSISQLPYIGSSYMVGGDIKICVYNPEEGLTWAIRGAYDMTKLNISMSGTSLAMNTNTASFDVIVSRRFSFADPYMGIGLNYTWGSFTINNPFASAASLIASDPVLSLLGITVPSSYTQKGSGYGAQFFVGVDFRIPAVSLKITLEGAYSPFGMNSLGTKFGFAL